MSSTIFVSISEHQILKAILEFLENRHFHITQVGYYVFFTIKFYNFSYP